MKIFRIRYETAYKYDLFAYVMADSAVAAELKLRTECTGFNAVTEVVRTEPWNDIVFVD